MSNVTGWAFAFFQQTQTESPWWFQVLPIVVIILVMYFLLLRPQVQADKKRRELIDNIKKGDKVITNGGIWGEIDTVESDKVKLKIGEKNKIVVSRSAISGFQPEPGTEQNQR